MKRILSLLLVMLMAFSVTASANSLESVAMMQNYEAEMTVSVTIEKPLTFLEKIPGIEEVYNFVELDALIESLVGSTVDMKVQGNISEDFSKMQAAISMTSRTPVVFNESAKITGEFILALWIDADFSDVENLKFDMIIQAPFLNKYLTVDAVEYLKEDEEVLKTLIETVKKTLNKETIAVISNELVDIIEKNATISNGNNTLNVNFDKDGANAYVFDMIKWAIDQSLAQQGEEFRAEYEETINESLEEMRSFSIFGDEGIKYQYIFDRSGNIKSSTGVSHIDLDLYPFLELALFDTEGLGKDECHFSFKVTETAKYSNVGRATVDFPKLTEENLITLKELDGGYEEEYYPEDYEEYPPYYIWVEGEYATAEDDTLYAALRGFLENVDNYHDYRKEPQAHFEYDYTDGVLTVKNNGCNFVDFTEIVAKVGESIVLIDGREIILDAPVREINDRVFLGVDFYEKAFGFKCIYATYEFIEEYFSIEFERIEEEYTEE